MGIDDHIHISACTHSSRYDMKITTRKAYATLKTFVFLRSLNVKDSPREVLIQPSIRRTHVSASYVSSSFSDPHMWCFKTILKPHSQIWLTVIKKSRDE